jgi:hypothetical protein
MDTGGKPAVFVATQQYNPRQLVTLKYTLKKKPFQGNLKGLFVTWERLELSTH